MNIEKATIVKILPTKVWIEGDIFGCKHVMLQHEGCEEFTYCSFKYDYRYTSNSTVNDAALKMAYSLGATYPVMVKNRDMKIPTREELIEEMKSIQSLLDSEGYQTGEQA